MLIARDSAAAYTASKGAAVILVTDWEFWYANSSQYNDPSNLPA